MNDTTSNLPAIRSARGITPWAADLLDQHDVHSEVANDFALFAIERYGADGEDVLDRALMLVSDHDADLEIVGELLDQGFNMVEIQHAYEAVQQLDMTDDEDAPTMKGFITQLIRFRRRFPLAGESEDLSLLIHDIRSEYNSAGRDHPNRHLPVRTFPELVAALMQISEDLGRTSDLTKVRQMLCGEG